MMEKQAQNSGQIVSADSTHLEAMAEIFKFGQQPHHEKFPDIFGPANDHDAIVAYLRGFLKPRNPFRKRQNFAACWLVDNVPKGYLLYQLYETANIFYGRSRQICFVEDIAVHPDTRGMGGASTLISYLNAQTDALDHCLTSAHVWQGNEASEKLFLAQGFDALSKTFYRQGKGS